MAGARARTVKHNYSPTSREVLRRRITSFLARRLETHEIVQLLCESTRPALDEFGNTVNRPNPSYITNPKTGGPYGKSTIYRIKDEIVAEWRRKDAEKLEEYYGDVIGGYQEILRRSFADGDYEMALSVLDRFVKLIGAAKPVRIDLNVLKAFDWEHATSEQLERIAEGNVDELLGGMG